MLSVAVGDFTRPPPRCMDIWRAGKIIKAVTGQIIAGQGPVVRAGETVCKTVGSAYVGSNPTPATTS
jgi:hypothetical protein